MSDQDTYEIVDLEKAEKRPKAKKRGGTLLAVLVVLFLLFLVTGAAFYRFRYEPLAAEAEANEDRIRALLGQHGALEERVRRLEGERDGAVAERDRLLAERGSLQNTVEERDAQIADLEAARRELEERMRAEIASGDIELTGSGGRMSIGMADQILFPSGGTELSPRGRAVLTRVAESLRSLEGRLIQVEGHTDSMPLSAELQERYPTNWELSTARATNVVRFLMDECEVPGERLVASGFSQYQPRAPNRSTTGRRRNRRIELNLLPLPHRAEANPSP
jgi:chemotaxis protein MotB